MSLGKQFTVTPEASDKAAQQGLDLARGTHGTTMKATTPTEILPAKQAGVGTHYSLSRPDRAYYNAQPSDGWKGDPQGRTLTWGTDDPKQYASRQGWKWATEAVGQSPAAVSRKRAVVHHVEPQGTVEPDENLPWTSAMTADKLKVTDTEWIPPSRFEKEQPTAGMQGTLPNVNWNQFGGDHPRHMEQNWHEYGINPAETATQRLQRRMVADGRLPADSPHNPDLDAVRNAKPKGEIPGQMEMVDRPPTWYDEGKKADI